MFLSRSMAPCASALLALAGAAASLHCPTAHAANITINNGAIFSGAGNANNNVTVNSGGQVSPGTAGINNGIATMSLSTLTLNAGAQLDYDIGPASNDLIALGNGLVINGPSLLQLRNLVGDPVLGNLTLNLFQITGSTIPTLSQLQTNVTISNPIAGATYSWGSNGSFLTLSLAMPSGTWNVNRDGGWDEGAATWAGTPPNGVGSTANFGNAIAAAHTVSLNGTQTVGILTFNNPAAPYTLAPGANGTLVLDNAPSSAQVNVTGSHFITAPISFNSNTTFSLPGAGDSLRLSGTLTSSKDLTVSGGGKVILAGTQNLANIFINAGATLRLEKASGTPAAVRLQGLTLAGDTNQWTSTLDVKDSALVLQTTSGTKATVLGNLENQITSGSNGGFWNGTGITSSTLPAANTTVIVADNADLHLTTFRGLSGLDSNTLIVGAAHLGDANLDGKVDGFDLNQLAAHWLQKSGALWSAGDFSGPANVPDGKVDAYDLNVLAAFWQFGVQPGIAPAQLSQITAIAVPEPSTVLILPFGALLCLLRQRFHLHYQTTRGNNLIGKLIPRNS